MSGPERLRGVFRDLLESAPDAIVIVDVAGEIVLVNGQTEKLFGYRREQLLCQRVELLVPERFRRQHAAGRIAYFADPQTRSMGVGMELYGRRSDGSEFPVDVSLSPLQTEDGLLVWSAVRDATERQQIERKAAHFAAVVESSHDAIIGKDLEGIVMSWNPGAKRLYGYGEEDMRGKSVSVIVPPGRDDELREMLRRVRSGETIDQYETVRTRKDGTQIAVSLTISPIRGRDRTVIGASTIARDITSRQHYMDQLLFLAEHDALTGVRNRWRFERDLSEQVRRARRYGAPAAAALAMIDIDGFKRINDAHGHKAGDRVLEQIGVVLRRRLRETDIVARIGGDEFTVLLPYAGPSQAQAVTEALRAAICEATVELDDGTKLNLSASVGTALIDAQTDSGDAVLAEADRAMYQDKARRGRPGHSPGR